MSDKEYAYRKYYRAAAVLKGMKRKIVRGRDLLQIPSIGDKTCKLIQEFLDSGKIERLGFRLI